MNNFILEACVETIEEAIKAEILGANRIELCSRLDLDGLTPDQDLIEQVCQEVEIPVKVMIRPRAGNFIYSKSEVDEMNVRIQFCKKLKVKGVVFGILDQENKLKLNQIKVLADLAFPLEVTIHKAIDLTPDILSATAELKEIVNITSILTSGGEPTAIEGSETLKKMIRTAGTSLTIIPAGRITNHNISEIHSLIGAREYHGRRIVGELCD